MPHPRHYPLRPGMGSIYRPKSVATPPLRPADEVGWAFRGAVWTTDLASRRSGIHPKPNYNASIKRQILSTRFKDAYRSLMADCTM